MSAPHLSVVTDTPTVDGLIRHLIRRYHLVAVSVTATAADPGYTITVTWPRKDSTVHCEGFNTPIEGLLHVQRVLEGVRTKRTVVQP